jgi:hypothetical protein
MIITGRRIKSLARRLAPVRAGATIVIGLTDLDRFSSRLGQVGFNASSNSGDTILPPATFGPVSLYNAEGRDIVHRNQPKETAYRQVEWHWTEWHGPYDRVEQSRIVDVPYERYPRTFVPPPSVEMTLATTEANERVLITPEVAFTDAHHPWILHTINLFLEIFGECSVLDSNLHHFRQPQLRRLNWQILPQGRMPWKNLRSALLPVIEREPAGNRPVIQHRLQKVNDMKPEFVAVGQGGFDGYVIFAFPKRHLFILECVHFGNATYVFGDDWEILSQMTKADVLDNKFQRDRIIHRENWDERIDGLFN